MANLITSTDIFAQNKKSRDEAAMQHSCGCDEVLMQIKNKTKDSFSFRDMIYFHKGEVVKMYIYRPHRGSLDEAMKECKEFDTKEEMIAFISAESSYLTGKPMYGPQDIVIGSSVINDYRIGWKDCRHVLVKRMGDHHFVIPQCIGWCATEYSK